MADSISSYEVARRFIIALGGNPNNTALVRAVAIWMRFENSNIVGNNPWNLHSGEACDATRKYCPGQGNLPGQIGNRYAGPGDRNVAVFATLDDGIRANANNLIRLAPSYGYGKVISEVREGDALGFLVAMQNSNWSAGHYGYAKLVNAFKGSSSYNWSMQLISVGGSGSDTSHTIDYTGMPSWLKDPNHVITDADVAELRAALVAKYPNVQSLGFYLDHLLPDYKGKTVKQLLDDAYGLFTGDDPQLGGSADNPLAAVGDFVGQLGNVLGTLVENVGLIIVFGAGALLAFYGFSLLMSVSGPATFEVPDELHSPMGGRR
jgi:hypothetical protein